MQMTSFVPIITACGGAVVGFVASYVIERFKRRSAMNDARRKAYASWFTAEALLVRRTEIVCRKLVGFIPDRERHDTLMAEIKSLVDDGRALVTAMNEAFLAEKVRSVRAILLRLNDFLVFVVADLENAAQHYRDNLAFHENFDSMTDDEVDALPNSDREEWIALRERFQKHDAECFYKSTAFRTELADVLTLVHKEVERLRDILAGTLWR